MTAASVIHIAFENEATYDAVFPLISDRINAKRTKSITRAARVQMKARKAIMEARRNPSRDERRATMKARKDSPVFWGVRGKRGEWRDQHSQVVLIYSSMYPARFGG